MHKVALKHHTDGSFGSQYVVASPVVKTTIKTYVAKMILGRPPFLEDYPLHMPTLVHYRSVPTTAIGFLQTLSSPKRPCLQLVFPLAR